MRIFKNTIFCFFVLCFLSVLSQDKKDVYEFISIREGMPKIGISTINQDNFGFIWIGTNGAGLYKYNGIDYITYKASLNDSTSMSSNLIYCTLVDSHKRLWAGTEDGLNLYSKEKDEFKKVVIPTLEKDYTNVPILSLIDDKKGNLLIGTFEMGMLKLNLKTLKAEKVISQNPKENTPISVFDFTIDNHNNIYAATDKGLKEYDDKTKTLKLSKFSIENGFTSIKYSIKRILKDINGVIWLGTFNNGLYRIEEIDEVNRVFKIENLLISNNNIFSLISLPDGTIMCGTENNGIFHIDANGKIIKNYVSSKSNEKSILSNSIWSLYLDKDERIWLGYYNKGVAVYDKLYDKFKDFESLNNNKNSLQSSSVTAITKDKKGRLWVGMDGGGIDIIDEQTKEFIHINNASNNQYKGLNNDYIETIFIDSNDDIWAGSWNGGVYFLKKGTDTFINYNIENTEGNLSSNIILSISEDKQGTIWFATVGGGLNYFSPKTGKFNHLTSKPFEDFGISKGFIWKILVDRKDNLWVGTTNGLYRLKKNTDETFLVESISEKIAKNSINSKKPGSHILSLYEGSNSIMWIGTRGAGICRYNINTESFEWYNKLNGFEEENVCAITENKEGHLWLSGNSGITKFDYQNKTFINYSKNDGLLSNDYNMNAVYKDASGILYFGNYQGIDFFDPENISRNEKVASVYLENLKIFNEKIVPNTNSPLKKVISETNRITLNNNQSVFTIEYGAINYTRPEKIEYAYYLEGYENDWNYVEGKTNATYTNLDPGEYIFKLKAANNDGLWNNKPLELSITILPPWWKTYWAIAIYLLIFLFGFYLLNYYTQERLKEKVALKNERTKRQHLDELNEKKIKFFTNISHEFRTPLTLILSPLGDILKDKNLVLPERIKHKLKVIHKNTDRLYRLINELLDFRKLGINEIVISAKKLYLVTLMKDIMSHFNDEALNHNIELSLDYDSEDLSMWADEKMLEKIIFNILSNAFKVTPYGGSINIELLSKANLMYLPLISTIEPVEVIEIIISDTGPGLANDELQRIFERFYQVENLNKNYYGSTGIGLEVVQNFVELHKGRIEVSSQIGEGTSFRLLFPSGKEHFNENELANLENIEASVVNKKFSTTNFVTNDDGTKEKSVNRHTLLIVEDNTELRNYLKEELKNDYKILIAKNGKEGLELAQEFLPNIIMADIIMPEMDGYLFCKHIKSDLRTSHIPLLMLTAKARIEDRMECIEIGADAYMVKPFDLRLLRLRLSQLITSRQLIFNKYFNFISNVPSNTANATSIDIGFMDKVLNYINENLGDPSLNVENLASQLNLSRSQFYRKIKALTNQTANEFLRNIRLQKAKQIIERGNNNISQVCYEVGFSSPSYFAKCFKNCFGMLPTEVKPIKK
ncbi:hybrid sensor histidine kinase/response regulator transcription factor [Mariniflexile sp.]|uniref:hybrid sensor histidine kinase/response regulator transcription factor n=1 Tax=Mariniflexile sp. TaxID=1979402 RepID=UPI0040483426